MVAFGAILVMVCVGYLTYTWWRDGRCVWVALGIILIIVNIALLIVSNRKVPAPKPSAGGAGPAQQPPSDTDSAQ